MNQAKWDIIILIGKLTLLIHDIMSTNNRIKELEKRIDELRSRVPPHSVPPRMLEEIEELEEELERIRQQ